MLLTMSWKRKCGLKWYWPICVSYKHIGSRQKFTLSKYPIPEIPDDSEKKLGMDRVLPKIIGSGRVSGTRQSLILALMLVILIILVLIKGWVAWWPAQDSLLILLTLIFIHSKCTRNHPRPHHRVSCMVACLRVAAFLDLHSQTLWLCTLHTYKHQHSDALCTHISISIVMHNTTLHGTALHYTYISMSAVLWCIH